MSILFEPIEINGMVIPNRFVRSATNDRCAEVSGRVTDMFIEHYEALAKGGIGLIVTGPAEEVLKTGGYIPFGDHLLPPDVTWAGFQYYRTKLNDVIDRYGE